MSTNTPLRGRGEDTHSAHRIEARERAAKALDLKKAGATYAQIAKQLGVSSSRARQYVERSFRDILPHETIMELIAVESERLDALQLGIWNRAVKGDLDALDRVLKIMVRRANLLGLDAPKRHEYSGQDGAPLQIMFEVLGVHSADEPASLSALPSPVELRR